MAIPLTNIQFKELAYYENQLFFNVRYFFISIY